MTIMAQLAQSKKKPKPTSLDMRVAALERQVAALKADMNKRKLVDRVEILERKL